MGIQIDNEHGTVVFIPETTIQPLVSIVEERLKHLEDDINALLDAEQDDSPLQFERLALHRLLSDLDIEGYEYP